MKSGNLNFLEHSGPLQAFFLVHLVGFIVRLYHDARSSECQMPVFILLFYYFFFYFLLSFLYYFNFFILFYYLGTTSWNPLGHSRPVTGLIYLLFIQPNTQLDCSRNVKTYVKIYTKILLHVSV